MLRPFAIEYVLQRAAPYLPDLSDSPSVHNWMLNGKFVDENKHLLLYFIPGLDEQQLTALVSRLPFEQRQMLLNTSAIEMAARYGGIPPWVLSEIQRNQQQLVANNSRLLSSSGGLASRGGGGGSGSDAVIHHASPLTAGVSSMLEEGGDLMLEEGGDLLFETNEDIEDTIVVEERRVSSSSVSRVSVSSSGVQTPPELTNISERRVSTPHALEVGGRLTSNLSENVILPPPPPPTAAPTGAAISNSDAINEILTTAVTEMATTYYTQAAASVNDIAATTMRSVLLGVRPFLRTFSVSGFFGITTLGMLPVLQRVIEGNSSMLAHSGVRGLIESFGRRIGNGGNNSNQRWGLGASNSMVFGLGVAMVGSLYGYVEIGRRYSNNGSGNNVDRNSGNAEVSYDSSIDSGNNNGNVIEPSGENSGQATTFRPERLNFQGD